MKNIKSSILETIGQTPLVALERLSKKEGLATPIIAKVEFFNPGGSVKDRVALQLIQDAEMKGAIKEGATIIEPTSGNTGVGLALVCALRKYKLILTMPDTMSIERRKLAAAYGAEIVLTPGKEGMKGAIAKAKELQKATPNSIIPGQFTNQANPYAHYMTTAEEIWADTDGQIDVFVAGAGTGGTVSGVGQNLKEKNPAVKIFAAEPATSACLSGEPAGPHKIQGIGAGFVPETYHPEVVDGVIKIENEEAFDYARMAAKEEGMLVGISSGCSIAAALHLAKMPEYAGKNIVCLLPDTGERYLSTALFNLE